MIKFKHRKIERLKIRIIEDPISLLRRIWKSTKYYRLYSDKICREILSKSHFAYFQVMLKNFTSRIVHSTYSNFRTYLTRDHVGRR